MNVRLLMMPFTGALATGPPWQVNNAVHFKGNTSRQVK
jgi:hypothetical protein